MNTTAPIEVEVKTLLQTKPNVERLLAQLQQHDPAFTLEQNQMQLNHYFVGESLTSLKLVMQKIATNEQIRTFEQIVDHAQGFSVRTRQANDTVLFIIKATVDDTSSENGTARTEFEIEVDHTLDELDRMILDNGFSYQAKWSRERQMYRYKQFSVSIDKNAGYGYLAEFERVVSHDDNFEVVKGEIRDELDRFGLEELSQDRLQRMFEYYNEHWDRYYGTDDTFTVY